MDAKGLLTMANENEVKIAKAKLYNLKSGVEGLVQMVDGGVIEPSQAMTGVITLAEKAAAEFVTQAGV
jgi:hypothetical protein